MIDLRIRPEADSDVGAIEALTIAAFLNAEHTSHTEQCIVAGLRKAGKLTISLVAERNKEIVGHVAISPVDLSDGTVGWFGLGPLSVRPEYQRKGIGASLVRAALIRLRENGAAGCVVLGNPRYYERFGFRADPLMTLPDVPPEYFLAAPFGRSAPRGMVTYHEAFGA